jgi:spermidine/putrescine transport system substrate-binding protein
MTHPSDDRPVKVLMSADTARHLGMELTRRRLLGLGGSAALAAFLAACGGDDDDDDASPPAATTGTDAPSATASPATSAPAASGTAAPGGDPEANSFKLFTWAEYDDPAVMENFGNIEITIYNSNEEAIQALVTAGGNGGYDMLCPTGVFIPQLAGEGLLEELDLSRIPNFKNLDPAYTDQAWDPGNKYSVCKDWGTTGWIYDKTVVQREIKTWQDFIDVAMNEASGAVSVLDSPSNITGMYFWANGIDWNTTDPAELSAAEDFLVNEFAPHIKAFDSYPGINLSQGNYVMSMAWNGDARQGLISVAESGGNVDDYAWAVGAPESELWMDNWCILNDAANLDACYNFINYILDPAVSAQDINFHGYNTGVLGSREALPPDSPFLEMVYFTEEEVSRMRAGSLDNQDAVVDIYNKIKAAAGA